MTARRLVDHPACACCERCAHPEERPGQYRPCRRCGSPITSSNPTVSRQLADQRAAGGRVDAVEG